MVIDRFTGPYGFLSNFSAAEVTFEGEAYPTVEHAFQAAKSLPSDCAMYRAGGNPPIALKPWRQVIREASTPAAAKRLGRRVTLRKDWEAIKIGVMRDLLMQKFAPGRKNLEWLLATDDATLIEGNTWGDTFWGVCDGKGENHLGLLLMEVRWIRRAECQPA